VREDIQTLERSVRHRTERAAHCLSKQHTRCSLYPVSHHTLTTSLHYPVKNYGKIKSIVNAEPAKTVCMQKGLVLELCHRGILLFFSS